MWLKRHEQRSGPLASAKSLAGGLLSTRFGLMARTLLVLGLILAAYYVGAYTPVSAGVEKALSSIAHIDSYRVKMYIDGKLSSPKRLVIDIKHENYQRLAYKREEALRRKLIVTADDSYVPAKITVDGRTYSVEMRLKGDFVDHLEGEKWSFRVKVKKGQAIWGMQRFSIQSPRRSGHIQEWIFHEWMRREGLIALRYDYISVVLNGRELGIFALEESFGKELIENNHRREGPILKFDESVMMASASEIPASYDKPSNEGDTKTQADWYFAADVDAFQTSKLMAKQVLRENFLTARNMLIGLRAGKRKLSDVFDVDKAARLFALLEVMNAHHSIRWKNVRFYFNPVNQRLELIAYNAYGPTTAFRPISMLQYQGWLYENVGKFHVFEWIDLFYSDPEFVSGYYRELARISAPGYLEEVIQGMQSDLDLKLSILYKDGPLLTAPIDGYFTARDRIYAILHPKIPLKAYLKDADAEKGRMKMTVANTAFLPVELHGVECSTAGKTFDEIQPSRLAGKSPGMSLEYVDITVGQLTDGDLRCMRAQVLDEDNMVVKGLRLRYEILGTGESRSSVIDAYPIELAGAFMPTSEEIQNQLELLGRKGVLVVDHGRQTVTLARQDLSYAGGMIVIPPGYRLMVKAGTRIRLNDGAAIVSFSPIHFEGTRAEPIIIQSDDNKGQGVTVISAKGSSVVKNVIASGQTSLSRHTWNLTGAFTFYESDVEISDSVFKENHSEDLINIVRSNFSIVGSSFESSESDAIDIDFGAGEIVGTNFQGCGNDCIDLSGSDVSIREVDINGAGDKGVSVGEQSTVVIRDTAISMVDMAVASKDGSTVTASNLRLKDSRVGFAVYRKKPEFSGATLTAERIARDGVTEPYYLEKGSSIVDDGRSIDPTVSSAG